MLDFVEERGFVFGSLFSQSCPAEGSVVLVCFDVFSNVVAGDEVNCAFVDFFQLVDVVLCEGVLNAGAKGEGWV